MNKPTLHVLIFRSNPRYSWNASVKAPHGMKPSEVFRGFQFDVAAYNCEDDDQCINDTDFGMIAACAGHEYEKQTGLKFAIPNYRRVF